MAVDPQIAAAIRQHRDIINRQQKAIAAQNELLAQMRTALIDLQSRPRSTTEEIDAIEGRRIEGTLSGEVDFDINDQFQRGEPITITVSQDGPFVMTHYPMVLWFPNSPDDTPNLGRWRPVSTFPLPTQQEGNDIIDLGYEIIDGGSKRMFQNAARGPLFSRPDNIVPCAIPTLFGSNTTIQFVPNYKRFTWDSDPAPTGGTLHVDFVGYYIANL